MILNIYTFKSRLKHITFNSVLMFSLYMLLVVISHMYLLLENLVETNNVLL